MNTPGKSGLFTYQLIYLQKILFLSHYLHKNKENAANPAGRLAATMQTKDP
jgi:hypothetical protein